MPFITISGSFSRRNKTLVKEVSQQPALSFSNASLRPSFGPVGHATNSMMEVVMQTFQTPAVKSVAIAYLTLSYRLLIQILPRSFAASINHHLLRTSILLLHAPLLLVKNQSINVKLHLIRILALPVISDGMTQHLKSPS